MGTRSRIGMVLPQGGIKSVYCHWDGYLQQPGVGWKLLRYYTNPKKIAELLKLGDLSSLGELVHPDPTRPHSITSCYGRDRGEEDTAGVVDNTLSDFLATANGSGAEYIYLWDGTQWRYCECGTEPTSIDEMVELTVGVITKTAVEA